MDSDPTPGDPEEVRLLADELQTFSDDVAEALGKVRGLASDRAVQDWAGLSAEAFRSEFDGVPGNLEKLRDSYDLCAQALGTYWPKLQAAQGQADRALDRAIAAQADLTSAQGALGDAQDWVGRAGDEAERLQREGERAGAPAPDEAEVRAATRDRQAADQARESAQARVDTAQDSLDAARELARQAREMREEAAREAARDIDEASDAGIQNRKWWQKAVHWVTENWDTIVDVCKVIVAVLGVVVMIIGGPLAWVVLAAALVVLADTLVKYSRGEAGLLDVAFAALDCIPGMKGLTTLGGLARGARGLASGGLRGMALGARGLGQRIRGMGRGIRSLFSRGDPVDMATGDVVMSATDVELPGVLPLVLERHHRTSVRSGTWFGRSWASTLDQRLALDADGARLCTEDGMTLYYPRPLPGEPVYPVEGPRWALRWSGNPQDPLVVHQRETGRSLHFSVVPGRRGGELPLTALTDRNGNRIRVEYDDEGAPTDVVHDAGYHVGITTHQRRITELRLLSDPEHPLLLRYGYDRAGNLTSVTNSSGLPLTFAYDHKRRLTRWEDRNGTWYAYTYDAQGRCVATDGTGGALASRIAYDPATHRTLFTDSLGNTTVYQFNDSYQLVTETDPEGHHTHRTWDRFDHLLTYTDALGHTTCHTYDDHGALLTLTRPDGGRVTVTRDDELGLPTEVVREDGARWLQEYDERGNPLTVTDPAGARTTYTHDARGAHTSTTDPLGHTTRIRNDAAGLTVALTDPTGATGTVTRDAFGRAVAVTDPTGATATTTWSTEGHPLTSTDASGAERRWTRDAEGNPVAYTDESGRTTRWTYGPFDLPVSQTLPDGTRHDFERDTELRVRRVTAPGGLAWHQTYDALGRLVAQSDFDGRTLTYTYDPSGALLSRTNALGQRVAYTYDANGALTGRDADGRRTDYRLDAAGRPVEAYGPDARVTIERDVLGRVLAETVGDRTVRHTYDPLGRPVGRTTPAGHHSATRYDAAGRPAELRTGTRLLRFDRDHAGRETARTLGPGLTLHHTWDERGLLTGQTLTAPGGTPVSRTWTHHADRTPASVTEPAAGRTDFTLDALNRITGTTGPGGPEAYAYDPLGNQTAAQWPDEDTATTGAREYAGTRVLTAGAVHHEYDAAGRTVLRRRKRLSRKPETWRYEWDAEDRLTQVTTPDGTRWRYLYDPFDRRTAKQRLAADGTVAEQTTYAWSGSTLIEQTTTSAADPTATTLTWDHHELRPVAQTERRAPAPFDAATAPDSEIDARFHAIVTGLTGAPTELVDDSGRIAWQARATVWGVTTTAPGATTDTPLRFPGQYADDETGWHYNLHRHYDPATARYTSPDPLGLAPARNPVAYVENPQTHADPLGLAPCPIDVNYGRPDGQIVLSGHGGIGAADPSLVTVPEGTWLHFYSRHGESIDNFLGNRIEMANPVPVRVWGPGSRVPDYHLYPPDGLSLVGAPRTVTEPTRLSALIGPNMGPVHWAACRSVL
ncbi:putative adhesin [Streptomyces sp. NPDC049879]|uniref:putative adhesin n=1 Tax=Streptomyces sp. NPDC049879 TaxID=3365598 RepID=UPI0037B78DBE